VEEVRKLNVAVIGAGFWGSNHLRVYRELPNANLLSICEVDPQRLKQAVEKYQIKGYASFSDLLKNESVEAVSICTWATRLAEMTEEALKAGKHVLVEKPVANDSKQAKGLIRLAENNDLCFMVGFIERYNPGVKNLKSYIRNGEVGDVVSALSRRVSEWPERIGDIGVVKDSAIHDIDILRFIFEEEPSTVYAKIGRLRHQKFEDYAQIMMTFKGGKTAFIEANWLTPQKVRQLIVTGSEEILSLDYISQKITIEKRGTTIIPSHSWSEPLKLELQDFVDSVLNNSNPLATGEDGLRALVIAEAVFKSSERERTVKLPNLA